MNETSSLLAPVRFAVDVIALAVVTLVLLFGGTQSGIVTPTFTWVTGVAVSAGLCFGFLFGTYSSGNERESVYSGLGGYPLVLFLIGILAVGVFWVTLVPPVYGSDLVYGVLAMIWTAFLLALRRTRTGR